MSEKDNLAVVQSAYAAFGRGDIPALLGYIAPEVEWENPGPTAIPWAGSFRGHKGVQEFFAALAEMVDFESFTPTAFFAAGDQVVVLGSEQARIKRNGVVYSGHWAHAFTLTNEKITHFREYGDSAGIAAAVTA